MWWRPIAEYNSLACIQFLLVKSYSRSRDFHHERSSVNQREAVWKKLLSIINTIMHSKGRNLTSPHPTKKFIWSFSSSSWKGRAHGVGSSGGEVGSMGKEPCWLLCPRGHFCTWWDTPLSQPPQLFTHLPPEDPTAFPYHRHRVQRIGLLFPLPWPSILHRQHWKNNWF